MKTLRALLIFAAALYPAQEVVPEPEWQGWQPWMFGAPCSLKIDYEDGACMNFAVKQKPDWSKKK